MAINIIRHGKKYGSISKKFLCRCGCYFYADGASYFRDDSCTVPRILCYCPECKNVANEATC